MQNKKRQCYTSSPKTSSSRCIRHSHIAGFTLIELLVVVSIIALLSTIVFAALSDARTKARNTAKNNLVMEYIKALELYRNDNPNGSYPIADNEVCVGYSSSNNETCYVDTPGSDTLITALQPYFSGDFAHRNSLLINNVDFKGVKYECAGTNGVCDKYFLVWLLEKQVSQCVSGATPNFNFPGNNTSCIYPESN